jgi:hypothetical protein
MSTLPIKTVSDKAPPGEPTADSPGRIRPVSMPASLGAANGTQPRKTLSLGEALAKQRDRRKRQQSFADDKGITFEEAGDVLKKAREIKAAQKKKQKEAEQAMKLQQQKEAERVRAQKSSPTASKPAVSEDAENVSIPALRDIDQVPSLEHSPVAGVDGGPTGPEGGKSGAQPFLLITS